MLSFQGSRGVRGLLKLNKGGESKFWAFCDDVIIGCPLKYFRFSEPQIDVHHVS